VFCYGLVCSSLHWTYQIERLRTRYRTIWFDYRGHQNSDLPQDLSTLTIPAIAKDLECLVQQLDLPPAVFLGHSMGVNVVLEFYRRRPDLVSGMVLANGTAKRPLETLMDNNVSGQSFKVLRALHDTSPRVFRALWTHYLENPVVNAIVGMGGFNLHLTPPEDVALYVRQISEMDPLVLLNLVDNYDTCDHTAWLHEVHVPTLILAGAKDQVIPLPQQELMHQLIPGSDLVVFPHGSHCSQMDLPEQVNTAIEHFLEKIGFMGARAAGEPNPPKETASPPIRPNPPPPPPSAS
jgi:pimeloyl-ACP methyl ester carboxylesterase